MIAKTYMFNRHFTKVTKSYGRYDLPFVSACKHSPPTAELECFVSLFQRYHKSLPIKYSCFKCFVIFQHTCSVIVLDCAAKFRSIAAPCYVCLEVCYLPSSSICSPIHSSKVSMPSLVVALVSKMKGNSS